MLREALHVYFEMFLPGREKGAQLLKTHIKPLSIFPVRCLDIELGYSFSRAVSFRHVNQHF